MTPLGNKLGEWNILQGEKYSDDLAGEQYSMGREILCWGVDDNFAGDSVVMLEALIDFAGDKKTLSQTIFPWLLAEDNPVISW